MRKLVSIVAALGMVTLFAGCGQAKTGDTEVYVFAAASLSRPMADLEASYEQNHPGVDIIVNTDSSGVLMTQIEEGSTCDIFFSAGAKQMNELIEEGLVDGTSVVNILSNSLVVVGSVSSGTEVEGLDTLSSGRIIAICDATVPAGRYTRQALVNSGLLELPSGGIDEITTSDIMNGLGVEVNEQSNVSKALTAVAEGSCDAGTCYLSDTYGYEDDVVILETVPAELTGDIIYPAARITDSQAADDFFTFLQSDEAMSVFADYCFEPAVGR